MGATSLTSQLMKLSGLKTHTLLLFILVLTASMISSCAFQKRKYRPGFHSSKKQSIKNTGGNAAEFELLSSVGDEKVDDINSSSDQPNTQGEAGLLAGFLAMLGFTMRSGKSMTMIRGSLWAAKNKKKSRKILTAINAALVVISCSIGVLAAYSGYSFPIAFSIGAVLLALGASLANTGNGLESFVSDKRKIGFHLWSRSLAIMSAANAIMPELEAATGGSKAWYVTSIVLLFILLFLVTVAALVLACVLACNGSGAMAFAALIIGFAALVTLGVMGVVRQFRKIHELSPEIDKIEGRGSGEEYYVPQD